MSTAPKLDIFVSHNSRDKEPVEQLAEQLLEEAGIHCWLDIWSIPSASDWQLEIDRALASCRAAAIVLGEHGWGPHHLAEAQVALARRGRDPGFRVVPVLLSGAKESDFAALEDFFVATHWVDLRDEARAGETFQRLVAAPTGQAPFPLGRPRISAYVIRRDARRWALAPKKKRDAGILYRGQSLRRAQDIASSLPGALDPLAQEFLQASAQAQARGLRRLLLLTAVIAAALVGLLLVAEQQRRKAEAERRVADEQRKVATERGAETRRQLSNALVLRAGAALGEGLELDASLLLSQAWGNLPRRRQTLHRARSDGCCGGGRLGRPGGATSGGARARRGRRL